MPVDAQGNFQFGPAGGYSVTQPKKGFGTQDILKQLQDAQDKANKANEDRYNQILSSFDTMAQGNTDAYAKILGSYDTMGQAGMTRIGQAEQQNQAQGTQNLMARGLGNTTVTSSVARGVANDAEQQRQALQESVAQMRGGVMQNQQQANLGILEGKAGVMERKTDAGPNLSLYGSLLQAMGQGQAQQPLAGGGSANSGMNYQAPSQGYQQEQSDWQNNMNSYYANDAVNTQKRLAGGSGSGPMTTGSTDMSSLAPGYNPWGMMGLKSLSQGSY